MLTARTFWLGTVCNLREKIDDIVNQALSDYLFVHRFRELRARMIKGIEDLGIRSIDFLAEDEPDR